MPTNFDLKAAADTTVALFTQFGLKILGAILGFFGVETTSFAGLFAAGGGAVRPSYSNANYWQVYFDTNRLIREAFGEAGFAAPAQVHVIRNA